MSEAQDGGKLIIKTGTVDYNIKIFLQDDGLGIAEENLTRKIQPFFTTKASGRGAGLGLSICHGVIKEHNGSIYAGSKLGKSSSFIIELPIVIENAPAELVEPSTREPNASES